MYRVINGSINYIKKKITNKKNNTKMSNKNKPSTSMTQVAYESKLRSVMRSGACGRIYSQETGWQSDAWDVTLSTDYVIKRHDTSADLSLITLSLQLVFQLQMYLREYESHNAAHLYSE